MSVPVGPARTPVERWSVPMGSRDRRAVLVAGDIVVLLVLSLVALRLGAVRSGWSWGTGFVFLHAYWPVVMVGLWLTLAWANGLYDPRRAPDRWMAAILSIKVSGQLVVVWAIAYFLPPPWTLVRHVAVLFAASAALVMPLWRQAYAAVFSRDAFRRRLLIVGAGWAGRTLLEAVRENAPLEIEVVGFADDNPALRGETVDGVPVVADRGDLVARAIEAGATDLALAVTRDVHADLFGAVMDARERGLVVTPMPVLYEDITGRVAVEHIGDQWAVALPLDPAESRGLYRIVRRGLDLVLGIGGALVLALLLVVVAPAILLTSPGPVFYRQTRIGRGGAAFTLYKLRTMIEAAEADGPRWAAPDDTRVTSVGRWLRRARLDELPQCLNVLRGEMSVVGPRPERPEFVGRLARQIPFYRARHGVRPGLTGWATVQLGYTDSEEAALAKLQHDLYYIKHQSLLLDFNILLRTAATMLRMRGR